MPRRRRLLRLVPLLAALAFVAAVLVLLGGGEEQRTLVPAGGSGDGQYDPLAYDPDREDELVQRAARGLSDPLYQHSPGGVVETAKRTARWRPLVERAAKATGTDADMIEAIVFLESAGRPDVIAGESVESAAGLTQILADTAMNLLDLRVDVAASRRLTRRIGVAESRGDDRRATRLRRARRRVDARFDPAQALAATGRYLVLAQKQMGREDLAVVSYHMGLGNLETALRRYSDADSDETVANIVDDNDLSYARLYFDSTPLLHASAYRFLSALGDDSSTYLWRVLAARNIMRTLRDDPAELERLEEADDLDGAAGRRFPGMERADDDDLEDPPKGAAQLGLSFASAGDRPRLRAEAMSALLYIGAGVKRIDGAGSLAVAGGRGASFAIARRYRSRAQALAFEFMLDRLQNHDLVAWVRAERRVYVTVSREAARVLPAPAKLVRDAVRVD